jgi:hypothetical protein
MKKAQDSFATITNVATVSGGASRFEQLVADNARSTAERFQLVQRGQLDREDFAFFLQNQRRAAKVITDAGR